MFVFAGSPLFSETNNVIKSTLNESVTDSGKVNSVYPGDVKFINKQDNRFRGIWYHIGNTNDETCFSSIGG